MNIRQEIQSFSVLPLTHQVMVSLLKDYKRPNDKVYDLVNEGVLLPVRKGLYVAGPAITTRVPEPFLLANHIMGPSYVSLDMALSYYGLIPERVFEITSMTTKATREFRTPVGLFSYTRLPLPYYAFGIRRIKLSEEAYAMVASPEKALTDKIITTSGIILRSQKQARSYLLEDLRMDEDNLKQLDTKMMLDWLADAPKKETLSILIKMIGNL